MKRLILWMLLIILLPLEASALEPLPAEQAFTFSATLANNQLIASWTIAPGYYLYRDRINFSALTTENVQIAPPSMPTGIPKHDTIFGNYQIYENHVVIPVILKKLSKGAAYLKVSYQGCARSGFCYPPINKRLALTTTPSPAVTITPLKFTLDNDISPSSTVTPLLAPQDTATALLTQHHVGWIILGFLGFGLLLAFTPCVLPMVPILASIIAGQGQCLTTKKAFFLSLTYVLAMAGTYALAGVVAGLAGSYVQAFFQSPWVLTAFSLLFVGLALSLFGLYELQLPSSWQERLTQLSNKQRGGTYVGVALMGCLATLIVSPCVTAPLIGALSYIGKTGDAGLGAIALLAMGMGMGVPLIIVGTWGGNLLPKAGAWLNIVKSFFGIMLLGVAIELLGRVLPGPVTLFLWAALVIIVAIYMGALTQAPTSNKSIFLKGISLIILVYGFLLLIGAAIGNTNPFQPLAINQEMSNSSTVVFKPIKTVEDLQTALQQAKNKHVVMLDFYADWCVACKEMDKTTFQESTVQQALKNIVVLRADVTANDAADRRLESYLGVIAPPTIVFFALDGHELVGLRVVGAIGPTAFLKQLQQVTPQSQSLPS